MPTWLANSRSEVRPATKPNTAATTGPSVIATAITAITSTSGWTPPTRRCDSRVDSSTRLTTITAASSRPPRIAQLPPLVARAGGGAGLGGGGGPPRALGPQALGAGPVDLADPADGDAGREDPALVALGDHRVAG